VFFQPVVIIGSVPLFIPLRYLEYDECYYGPHVQTEPSDEVEEGNQGYHWKILDEEV